MLLKYTEWSYVLRNPSKVDNIISVFNIPNLANTIAYPSLPYRYSEQLAYNSRKLTQSLFKC